ncbi:MAG: 2,3-bisphosphoglycerate-independent phosphoglycerate mutase [Rubricoccaceae bacterium]|nr:2,3-bisphosphoglycerate-independent phosphoglycerate mutase [Rubricoccaceae bacterium]
MNKHILIILDGYGIAEDPAVSAIDAARKPFLDSLFARYPHSTLDASGRAVGLPQGQMGNSEVGHMNLGAGRVVDQDITRIDKAIEDGSFFENEVLIETMRHALDNKSRLHLMGLVSDGGVHSHINHLVALLELAKRGGLGKDQVIVHVFTDGRDTDPHSGTAFVRQLEAECAETGVGQIGSVVGRYFAMDRDKRWDRTEKAYGLLVDGSGVEADDAQSALQASYGAGVTDEFVEPVVIKGVPRIQSGDAVLFFNFRADRARQITRALTEDVFDAFERGNQLALHFATFTSYHKDFDLPVAFPKVDLTDTLGEVISQHGGTQLRAAETEKYPHVTFFFNGGREVQYEGEDRILIPSPKVATYDLQPEMSAPEVAEQVAAYIRARTPDLVILNFANPDMVGHTGVFDAAVEAVEAVDVGTKQVVEAALEKGYTVQIIADHGNADKMMNPDGSPHTAHTTALVPHLIMRDGFSGPIRHGKLGDIAPTILHLMGVPIPRKMTGDVLVDGHTSHPQPPNASA